MAEKKEQTLALPDDELEQRPEPGEQIEVPDNLEDFEDESEEFRLTVRQKIIVGAVAFVSFLIATIVFLPYEEIVRSQLARVERQIKLEFTSLDLNLFSADRVTGFRAQLPDGSLNFGAAGVESGLRWRDLMTANPRGPLRLTDVDFSMDSIAFQSRTLEVDFGVNNFDRPAFTWQGAIKVRAAGLVFSRLPLAGLPLVGDINPQDLQIGRLDLNMSFNAGTVNFTGSRLTGNLFSAELKGTGRVAGAPGATELNAQICLRPAPELESKNPDLFGVYIMAGGAAGGELCVDLKGPAAHPQPTVRRSGMDASQPGLPTTPAPPP